MAVGALHQPPLFFVQTDIAAKRPLSLPSGKLVYFSQRRSARAGNVRAEAARRGISGAQLGRRLGTGQQWVARRWWGEVEWALSELEKVASVLGVDLLALIAGDENSPTVVGRKKEKVRQQGLEPRTR